MIRPDQIPDEAVEAAAKVIAATTEPINKWRYHMPEARAAICAAVKAWPGGTHRRHDNQEWLDLPLPQEKQG